MTCWSCGGGIPEGSRFCGLCGARQNPTAPQLSRVLTAWQPPPEQESETPTLINAPALSAPAVPPPEEPPRPPPRFRALAAVGDAGRGLPAQPVRPSAWGISEAPEAATPSQRQPRQRPRPATSRLSAAAPTQPA
ncbi:MAG: hypothetical protein H6706_15890 [Myxococcales bacterium]|nr:hypothetical protein [Myxococcales bacterium]